MEDENNFSKQNSPEKNFLWKWRNRKRFESIFDIPPSSELAQEKVSEKIGSLSAIIASEVWTNFSEGSTEYKTRLLAMQDIQKAKNLAKGFGFNINAPKSKSGEEDNPHTKS